MPAEFLRIFEIDRFQEIRVGFAQYLLLHQAQAVCVSAKAARQKDRMVLGRERPDGHVLRVDSEPRIFVRVYQAKENLAVIEFGRLSVGLPGFHRIPLAGSG